ncbi:angiopoietin-related protein 1 [Elysia marginata]|uniref:Angiopoietin-related protein 1 n=1 Tax=Elysia marginata TaxID=1093978 RepID=A0AAV4FT14_9GAST|nr:angiopoietin-related protein 1 [Elysia marginata]
MNDLSIQTATTCEALRFPLRVDYNESIPTGPEASDFFNETLTFVETLELNGTTPEEGSDAFEEILNLTLTATEAYEESSAQHASIGGGATREAVHTVTGSRFFPINHALGFRALCDTQADGGGWTVVQRRTSGLVSFDRRWRDYENGFGNMDNGYWLGLRNMRRLIERGDHEVRFEFTNSWRQSKVVQYNRFSIGPSWDRYRLAISALDYNRLKSTESGLSIELHNLMRFTTVDRDHDNCLLCNCAFPARGGWWYYSCSTANLNGLWGVPLFNLGPSWIFFAGLNTPLKATAMMIRRR